jgi:LmbE family N-acetylglucosaminyl deacetylase
MKKILVIAAHPDDEVLGCGGALVKHKNSKDEISLVFLSDGFTSRKDGKNRSKQLNLVKKYLKVKNLFLLNFKDNQLDQEPLLKIIKNLETIIKRIKPEIIYTHSDKDLNIDHQITSKATVTASRLFKNKYIKKILFFEILSSTEQSSSFGNYFSPNYFIDITTVIKDKIKLCTFYKNEFRKIPFPRSYESVKTLAKYRGNFVGKRYVEAFEVFRILK